MERLVKGKGLLVWCESEYGQEKEIRLQMSNLASGALGR